MWDIDIPLTVQSRQAKAIEVKRTESLGATRGKFWIDNGSVLPVIEKM
jgi:hypothetical protein